MDFPEKNLFLKNSLSPDLSISPDVHIRIGTDGAPHAYYRDPLTGDDIEVGPCDTLTTTDTLATADGAIGTGRLTGAWTAAGSARGSGKSSWITASSPSPAFSVDVFDELREFDNIKKIYASWYPDDPAEFDENTFKELPTKVILEFAEALKRDIKKNKIETSEDVIEYLRKKGLVV